MFYSRAAFFGLRTGQWATIATQNPTREIGLILLTAKDPLILLYGKSKDHGNNRISRNNLCSGCVTGQMSSIYRLCRGPRSLGTCRGNFPLQRTKLVVVLPAGPEQGHEIFQAKLEVLDLVATKRSSGESALAFLQGENTLLDRVLDR